MLSAVQGFHQRMRSLKLIDSRPNALRCNTKAALAMFFLLLPLALFAFQSAPLLPVFACFIFREAKLLGSVVGQLFKSLCSSLGFEFALPAITLFTLGAFSFLLHLFLCQLLAVLQAFQQSLLLTRILRMT